MNKDIELKQGLRIKDKFGNYGFVALDSNNDIVAVSTIEGDTVTVKLLSREDLDIAECIDNPEVKCNYTGKNAYGFNCEICRLNKLKEQEGL